MKIAILHSGDLANVSLGGIDRYVKNIILFSNDYEITIFGVTRNHEHEIGKTYEKEYMGVKYYFVPIISDKHYPLSIRYMLKEFFWVSKLGKFDCIYAQRTEFSIPFKFSKHKNKLIQMIHGSSKYSAVFWGKKKARVQMFFEKKAIKIAARTYVILNREEFGVPYYKKQYPKYANKFFYGRNPINTSYFYPRDKKEVRNELGISFPTVVSFVGRVENNPKRVLLFPQLMEELIKRFPNLGFVVVGVGADLKELIKIVDEKGMSSHFIFTGYIDDMITISKYVCASDITINISSFEGTCTSNLESVACSVPVISTDVGDIKEIIADNANGLIIPNDEGSIVSNAVNAITQTLNNGIKMTDSYLKYDGKNVVEELKKDIWNLA